MALYPRSIDDDFRSAISAFPSIVRSPGTRKDIFFFLYLYPMKGSYRSFFPSISMDGVKKGRNVRRSRIVAILSRLPRKCCIRFLAERARLWVDEKNNGFWSKLLKMGVLSDTFFVSGMEKILREINLVSVKGNIGKEILRVMI